MVVWFNPNHGTEFLNVGSVFWAVFGPSFWTALWMNL